MFQTGRVVLVPGRVFAHVWELLLTSRRGCALVVRTEPKERQGFDRRHAVRLVEKKNKERALASRNGRGKYIDRASRWRLGGEVGGKGGANLTT